MINAGGLRHRFEVFQISESRDQFGSKSTDRTRLGTYWCSFKTLSNAVVGDNTRQNQTITEFKTRYNKQLNGLNNTQYLVFNNIEYDITSVFDPNGLKDTLIITATRRGY